jgi:DNA-directed RNA polymerase specialized sigma24 family protein
MQKTLALHCVFAKARRIVNHATQQKTQTHDFTRVDRSGLPPFTPSHYRGGIDVGAGRSVRFVFATARSPQALRTPSEKDRPCCKHAEGGVVSIESETNRDRVYHALQDLPVVKQRIVRLLERKPNGLTRHEIAAELGMPLSSVCGRVKELEDAEFVHSTAETRETPYGKPATVICITHRNRPVQLELF